jgi:predicted Zn-dependent peptidase
MALSAFTLPNGLRVVLYPEKGVPLAAVNLWYAVGSKDERPGKTGFAHLFEHLMFEGSRNVRDNEHFLLLERVGGVANGSTWLDHTNYYETLAPEHLELALFLESNRMGWLLDTLEQKKLDGQRSVVKNERRWRVDNRPYGVWDEKLYEMAFPAGHPYHHPVIGYMEDLDAATLDDVEGFFRTHYTPSNAVLTIAGAVEPRRARGLVEKHFGPIPGRRRPARRPVPKVHPVQGAETVLEDSVALSRVYLLYYAPAYGEAGFHEAETAAYALGDGRGSILYRDLVLDARVASSTAGWFLPAVGVSTLVLCVTGQPGVALPALREAVVRSLEQARTRPWTEAEARRARNLNLSASVLQWESLTQRANLLSEAATVLGDPGAAFDLQEGRRRVDREGLQAFIRRTLAQPPILLGFMPRS